MKDIILLLFSGKNVNAVKESNRVSLSSQLLCRDSRLFVIQSAKDKTFAYCTIVQHLETDTNALTFETDELGSFQGERGGRVVVWVGFFFKDTVCQSCSWRVVPHREEGSHGYFQLTGHQEEISFCLVNGARPTSWMRLQQDLQCQCCVYTRRQIYSAGLHQP